MSSIGPDLRSGPKSTYRGVPAPQSGSGQGPCRSRGYIQMRVLWRGSKKGTAWNSSKSKVGCRQTTQERAESWATYHRVATALAQHTGIRTPALLSPLLLSCRNEEQVESQPGETEKSSSAAVPQARRRLPQPPAIPASGRSTRPPALCPVAFLALPGPATRSPT